MIVAMCLLKEDPSQYAYINQGCLTVDHMDDKEEMRLVDVSSILYSFIYLENEPSLNTQLHQLSQVSPF